MIKNAAWAQLLLRCALGIGFILPVLDRIGWLGVPGSKNVAWGNWENFTAYTHALMPYLGLKAASFFGLVATVGEIIIGLLLLLGYKTKWVSLGSSVLTFIFALSMLFFANYRAPFNYAVFVVSFSSLLLSKLSVYNWSIDKMLSEKSSKSLS